MFVYWVDQWSPLVGVLFIGRNPQVQIQIESVGECSTERRLWGRHWDWPQPTLHGILRCWLCALSGQLGMLWHPASKLNRGGWVPRSKLWSFAGSRPVFCSHHMAYANVWLLWLLTDSNLATQVHQKEKLRHSWLASNSNSSMTLLYLLHSNLAW